jgi:hypothetical protein
MKYDKKNIEKYSSAFTLSDMEIFIYPELFYSLVLANIMSPKIWEWKKDPWFDNIDKKSFNQKMNRIKQYIMDHYVFNLDLDTWGLTTKQQELNRFEKIIDTDVLKNSNALFGYEGDKYYFSIDIRKHFGLDQFNDEVIPYWKTETVEAMDAFQHKSEYSCGAGECVSLSSLYAAALFIIGKVPLEKIFLIATPLHSQNFITEKDGIITNNRRIVTKNMWFNGTELSAKARRALENEKVTIVSHISGLIHTMYEEATIDPEAYETFSKSIAKYLKADFTAQTFLNFIRTRLTSWKCFQYKHQINNKDRYIDLETIFKYEHNSKNKFSAESRKALLNEIDRQEFSFSKRGNKIIINDLEQYLRDNSKLSTSQKIEDIFELFIPHKCNELRLFFMDFKEFLETKPRLPVIGNKKLSKMNVLDISVEDNREKIIEHIYEMADKNDYAHYAVYAYRDMKKINWIPFIKACIERNPVLFSEKKDITAAELYQELSQMPNDSIYNDQRLALPDEVWNFKRGDGIEKLFTLLSYLIKLEPEKEYSIEINNKIALLVFNGTNFSFESMKQLSKRFNGKGSKVQEI